MPQELVHGWTGPLDFQLTADGVPVDLTGMTVTLVLRDRKGAAVAAASSILSVATGTVRYLPVATDLDSAKAPYTAHWKITDGGNKVVFFPNDEPDVWLVYPQ